MSLEVINYDKNNHTHLDWAIALRDCVQYLIEEGHDVKQALTELGIDSNKRYICPFTNTIRVSLLELSDELRDKLVIKKQDIKNIRRGA